MPLYIVIYDHPNEEGWKQHVKSHIAWLQTQLREGTLLASGGLTKRTVKTAMLIISAPDRMALDQLIASDPFAEYKLIANMTVTEWDPIFGAFNQLSSMPSQIDGCQQTSNEELVRRAFDAWAKTGGGMFDILADDVRWTIAGSKPSGHTFHGRTAFLEGAFDPISARFAGPMKPTIRDVLAEGDIVTVRWDGVAPMKDGQTYRNSYAWFFKLRGGKVIEATAFLDLPTYDAALTGAALPPWPTPTSEQQLP